MKLYPVTVRRVSGAATVQWEPGDAANRATCVVAPSIDALSLETTHGCVGAAAADAMSCVLAAHTCTGTASVDALALNATATCQATAAADTISLDHDTLTAQGAATVDALSLDIDPTAPTSPTVDALSLDTTITAPTTVPAPTLTTSATLAAKDSWTDTVAGCVGEVTHDATDLQVDSTVATSKDTYFSFDLSGFSGSTTVTAATLTINVKTAPVLSSSLSSFSIADAGETWAEATIKCSNRPAASGGNKQTLAIGNTTGEKSFALSAAWLSRLDARMGQTSVTFLLQMATAASSATFESKDEGTNNALGPRLAITFTTP